MHLCLCIHCSEKFQDRDHLFEHMKAEEHLQPPKDSSEWDQPQVFAWKLTNVTNLSWLNSWPINLNFKTSVFRKLSVAYSRVSLAGAVAVASETPDFRILTIVIKKLNIPCYLELWFTKELILPNLLDYVFSTSSPPTKTIIFCTA